MRLKEITELKLPPTADFHVHLRQGAMMELVTPSIEAGGCNTVFVMPNLQPPLTKVADVLAYHEKLTRLAPRVNFLMSLYLNAAVTPETIEEAARSGVIHGVKLYPAGVTTNSQDGVLDIEQFYPVFRAMEKHDIVLNLHGEMTSSPPESFQKTRGDENITVLNAEPKFLPQLFKLHAEFPKLRIVLEHVSTRAGLEAVRKCGPKVAGTITAHHLLMTIDDWAGDVFSFCKPVAKTPEDRVGLVRAIVDNPDGKFFFGSDSAPHAIEAKKGLDSTATAAGCFTQPWSTALVLAAVEEALDLGWIPDMPEDDMRERLEGFLSRHGRAFYNLPAVLEAGPGTGTRAGTEPDARQIRLVRRGEKIPQAYASGDGTIRVVPFARDREVFSVEWVDGQAPGAVSA